MEKQYLPQNTEERIYSFWEKNHFFIPKGKTKKTFSMVLPPPNVTGSLHMGHALNAVIQDILVRRMRMKGINSLWLPGTDHAGIATQNVVEKELKKQGKTRFDLGKEEFIKRVWEWKEKYGNIILNQFKRIGSSCDWTRTRFTMDENYTKAVYAAFFHYHEKGWVYRGRRVVNWCSRCRTSLSDLELEYTEEKTNLYFIKYKVVGSDNYITVATTRPETMLGDTAVAVFPKDKRYENLIGKKVIVPIVNREVPIIEDRAIEKEFGTGALKVTPAHSTVDYNIGKRHNLEVIEVIDERKKMKDSVPIEYRGLGIDEARTKIVEDLNKQNLIEKVIDYENKLPRCYRCSNIIEFLPSDQWFVKMDELAKISIKAVKSGKVKFHPKRFEKTYSDWLKKVEDWCISRQLWWGHRIPAYFCEKEKDKYFVSEEQPKSCPVCKSCTPKQTEDVFDTWFSSALWPFATLGWPKETEDLKTYYPTSVLSTARDIINLWVARMTFSGLSLTKKAPFSDVIIHPTVLTKEGKRMSKSLGTGIDPMVLIEKYGADAVRFGLTFKIADNQDLYFNEDDMMAGRKFCNKIWNASRFVMQEVGEEMDLKKVKAKTAEDKKIMKALNNAIKVADKNIAEFHFAKALQKIYHFFWHDFCDVYIEKSKGKMDENTRSVLMQVLTQSLKILHPFIPFVTEEIYGLLKLKDKKALIVESWPL